MESASDNDEPANTSDRNTSQSPAERLQAKKKLLKKEIKELEELSLQIECNMNISKFGDINHLLTTPQSDTPLPLKDIRDVQTEIADELHQLAGMHLTKFTKNEYVFSFPTQGKNDSIHTYGVQIKMNSGVPQIGKWVMPPSADIKNIELDTPLKQPMDLRPFLNNCKHHIACFTNRVKQYNSLQEIVSEKPGCWLDSTRGHTVVTLKFFELEERESGQSHNVIIYLIYDPQTVRPQKMKIDPLNSEEFTDATMKELKKFFKHFKSFDLETAFEKTFSDEDSPIIWKRGEVADVIEYTDNSSSSSSAGYLSQGKRKKMPLTRGRKRKKAETSMRSQRSLNRSASAGDSNLETADEHHLSLSGTVSERRNKLPQNKEKPAVVKLKKNTKAKSKAAPGVTKKPTKLRTSPRKNVKSPSVNVSKINLKQRTLNFPAPTPQVVEPTASIDKEVPLAERAGLTSRNITEKKPNSNATILPKGVIGTSTPVSHSNRNRKRFAAEKSIQVSPIESHGNTSRRQKKTAKK